MTKAKLKFLDVSFDTKPNVDGVQCTHIFISFDKTEKNFYRISEFLSRGEKLVFNNKFQFDFENTGNIDVSDLIQDVSLCKEDNKYGTKHYISVKFSFGYEKQIKIENDAYFLLNMLYQQNNTTTTSVEIEKSNKK